MDTVFAKSVSVPLGTGSLRISTPSSSRACSVLGFSRRRDFAELKLTTGSGSGSKRGFTVRAVPPNFTKLLWQSLGNLKSLANWKFYRSDELGGVLISVITFVITVATCTDSYAEKAMRDLELINTRMPLLRRPGIQAIDTFLIELMKKCCKSLDKVRCEEESKLAVDPHLFIRIIVDKTQKCICVSDTGSGMTKSDLEDLGHITIFVSKETRAAVAFGAKLSLFGQAFHSCFLVADKVVVSSKHNDDEQYIWESNGESFSLCRDISGEELGRGTKITLFLKDDQVDYLEEIVIKDFLRACKFLRYPVYLWTVNSNEPKDSSMGIRLKNSLMSIFHLAIGKPVSEVQEGLELDDETEEKRKKEEKNKSLQNLCEVIKDILGDKVEKVVVSDRIVVLPCMLVTEFDWSTNMERIMKAQALRDAIRMESVLSKKMMEFNPNNHIVEDLRKKVEADKNDKSVKDLVMLLFDTAFVG